MTVKICDICKKEPALTLWLTVDRRMGAAGSMDDVSECFDLCHEHSGTPLAILHKAGKFGHKEASLVAEGLKSRITFRPEKNVYV